MRTPSIFACARAALVLVAGALTQRSASQTAAPNWPQLTTELRPAESFAGISDTQIRSIAVFEEAGKVLQHPRCMNCHPAGDIPLQGDDSHLHQMSPRRGVDGKGVYAMKCSNCHQPTNTAGLHTPPGNPKWHLPPADMKMVFEGRSAHQLAKQIMDPKQNGHKNKSQLIAHASDTLVTGAWNPGEGRTLPPMTHDEFKKAWVTWIQKGGYAPKSK